MALQRPARGASRWVLAAILLLAFCLRVWNLDWDRGTHLHPDERFWSDVAAHVERPAEWRWSEVLDPEVSPLNPRVHKPNYVYGTLPLWGTEAVAAVMMTDSMSWIAGAFDSLGVDLVHDGDGPVSERLRFNTGYDVNLIGRLVSALIDTATVAAVYLLARQLADRSAGLLAALLQAVTVLHIQYAHFLGSEPWVALFVTVVVWGSVKLARGRGGWPTRLITGVALGLAIGSKLSGVAGAAAPVVAALVLSGSDLADWWRARRLGSRTAAITRRIWRNVETWLVSALVAVVAYRIVQPYDFEAGLSLVFNDRFQADVDYLNDINQGGNWPWVQPLVGATPLWHPLKQLFWWGMGPGLALAALGGGLRAIARFRRGEWYWAVPLAVIGAYFVLVSLQFYAIVRYLQPAYPAMVALAACGLVAAWRWAGQATAPVRLAMVARVAVGLAVAATVFWGLAFTNGVYGRDNARLAAGDWMLENLAPDTVVSQQSWDDGLPWANGAFERVTLEPFSFGGDTPEGIERLIAGLDQVDYVIESSNKFYDALPLTPARFPQITEYYERLFDGSLGFELAHTFTNRPSLFGIEIDDSGAEEAFTVYDHPTVYMWAKTDEFSVERARELLNPDRARVAVNAIPKDAYANGAMLTPDEYDTQQQGSSYREVHPAAANSFIAMFSWFVVVQIAGFSCAAVVLPLAGRAAGAAWGLTKALGLVVLGLPIWLVVAWGWVNFSTGLVWLGLIVVAGLGGVLAVRNIDGLRHIWSQHRRAILAAEAVFVGVFLAVVALRVANPDMWHMWRGGEKPMELAYFTAVTGSTTMPPYDPWLAGGSLNYYYFGWFLLAVPTRILGIAPDIAFNLGVATYAALAAVTVFATTSMLAELAGRMGAARSDDRARSRAGVRAGLLGALLFLVIGNLDALRQVVRRLSEAQPLSDFDWWDPSRVIKDSPGFEVTEFPAFTVLFADLHPHFMAMGIFGLGLAGAAALIERARQGRALSVWVLTIGLGVGSGVMRMVHTWDLPAFGLIAAGAVVIAAVLERAPTWWRVRTALARLATLGVVHLAVTAPYRAHNQVADSGFHRSESVSKLDDWVAHWGLFLFVALFYLVVRTWQLWGSGRPLAGVGSLAALVIVAGGWLGAYSTVGSVAAWSWVGLIVATGVLVAELRPDSVRGGQVSAAHVFVAAAWALGFGILLGVESFTQNADIARLNTVFKFWLQVWHLFAVIAAFGAVWVIGALRAAVAERPRPLLVKARQVFAGGLVALVLASLLYPALAVRPRSANRIDTNVGRSLQGHLWLEPGQTVFGIKDAFENEYAIDPGLDRPVIDWLRANVDGRPTIVEAVGGAEYQWWGRISITTGLPTVLGWRWHQVQQRTLFGAEVNDRKADVSEFFVATDRDHIDRFLRTYDVSYVVIGSIEAAIAAPETLALLADHPGLQPVFRQGDQVIYRVS